MIECLKQTLRREVWELMMSEVDVVVAEPALRAGVIEKKAGVGLIVLLGCLAGMGPLAIDMYLPTMPGIAVDLHTTMGWVERTLSSYFVGLAIGQVIYGTLSDRWGRKRPLFVGLAVFGLASVGCAMARSVEWLLALRFLQALGGCAEMVISRAIVRDRFDGREGARVFSSLMLVMGAAPILAPLMGGFFATHGGWRMSFWLLALVAGVCFVAVAFFLDESLAHEKRVQHGVTDIGRVFAGLLRHRQYMAHVLASSFMLAGLFAYVGGSSFVFIELYHIEPRWFWTIFGGNAAGLISASQVNGYLVRRVEPFFLLRWALVVSVIAGTLVAISAVTHWGGAVAFFVPLFFFVATFGFVFPSATALAMGPQGHVAGNASALLGCMQFAISGVGTWAVSFLHDGTARPMAEVMLGAAVVALGINLVMGRHVGEGAGARV
jgi:MFS transporter, DHA1 family, multidrug resistance protein